ncbi:MAG: hypothetical protein JRH19_15045 [Deltaproteobacteria bacterium]|nr:hypothetical protein [Deltaproteobacteria bacterium]
MEGVVQALGDAEELGIALDHHPARVDSGAARVAEQRLEHLRHTATHRGGVHVPHDPARKAFAQGLGGRASLAHLLFIENGFETLE